MKKINKGIAIIITVSLLVGCIGTITVAAIVPPEDAFMDFDINQYTIYDLIDMSTEERKNLLDNFIETYNPYGIKDIMESINMEEMTSDAEPQWSSGRNLTGTEQTLATHQLVTIEAFARFIEKYGFHQEVTATEILVIALYLGAASGLPDIDETDGLFKAHFYDPDTGLNILLQNEPTARTQTGMHYYNAWGYWRENVNMNATSEEFTTVIECLGRALHYLQDLCEPHHASNKPAGLTNHKSFEDYVEGNIVAFIDNVPEVDYMYEVLALEKTAFEIAHLAAQTAKPQYNYIKNGYNFNTVGQACINESVYFSEALIYKLFFECLIMQ